MMTAPLRMALSGCNWINCEVRQAGAQWRRRQRASPKDFARRIRYLELANEEGDEEVAVPVLLRQDRDRGYAMQHRKVQRDEVLVLAQDLKHCELWRDQLAYKDLQTPKNAP